MLCVNVKIPFADRLQEEMQNMRVWLDHRRLEPVNFMQSSARSGTVFRIYFEEEAAASAFATAFGGRVENASRSALL